MALFNKRGEEIFKESMKDYNNFIEISHEILQKVVKEIKTDKIVVVDATLGNGYDTKFLSQLLPKNSVIYSFDIQNAAIIKSIENNYESKCKIIFLKDSHINCDKYISCCDLAIFNLGYLPGGRKSIKTEMKTTVVAIDKLSQLLNKRGLIFIIVYLNHNGGEDEYVAILQKINKYAQSEYNVLEMQFINQINNPPHLFIIQKR